MRYSGCFGENKGKGRAAGERSWRQGPAVRAVRRMVGEEKAMRSQAETALKKISYQVPDLESELTRVRRNY